MILRGMEVIIIGAGVAGLAAALALRQRGASVLVLEQAEALREFGAGLQISPNGARVLAALGLDAELPRKAMRSKAVVLRDAARGSQVLRLKLPQAGPGFYLVHRADLIGLLGSALDGVEMQFAAHVATVAPDGPRPSVTLTDGRVFKADLVLGADGLHSVLRGNFQGNEKKAPFFTGQVAWRALVPGDSGPAEAQVFMGPGRHLVTYPLRGGAMRNLVAVEERRDWVAEGWNHRDDPAHLQASFSGFGGPVREWLAQVQEPYLWGLFRHEIAPRWWHGQAALLGDAAHPTLPFMAQGANLALEDAYVLAGELCHAPLPAALAAYQTRRQARVRAVVAAANSNARNYHLRAPLAQIAHMILRLDATMRPQAALRRFDWIYGHDVTQP